LGGRQVGQNDFDPHARDHTLFTNLFNDSPPPEPTAVGAEGRITVTVILCVGGVAHLHSNLHSIFVILRNTEKLQRSHDAPR
jgi:hypothetical protein